MKLADPLSYHATEQLLASAHQLKDAVLVGGQALNYWAEALDITGPDAAPDSPFGPALSADIDFLGSADAARELAKATGGKVAIAGAEDVHSPNTAAVTIPDGDAGHLIDFLASLKGFTGAELRAVRKWAVAVRFGGGDARLLVMHPLHCLASQLENVYGSALDRRSGRDGARHAKRVALAVEACRRIVTRYLKSDDARSALRIAERAHELTLLPTAMRALDEDGTKIEVAIPIDEMPDEFRSKRWPQLVRERDIAQQKHRRLQERRKALAKKKKR